MLDSNDKTRKNWQDWGEEYEDLDVEVSKVIFCGIESQLLTENRESQ